MTVREVLAGVRLSGTLPEELARATVEGLEYDSRRTGPRFLFFAFPGARVDGRQFARQAIERGALAVLSELDPPPGFDGAWLKVEHGRRALATAARNFYGRPDELLQLTGITGTNGKTTTSYLIDSVFQAAGATTGLIGTIEYHVAGERIAAANTTPESLDTFRLLDQVRRKGGTYVTMEVSSHALALGRAYGLKFHTAVFTNLTRDHLDFHRTMEEYLKAKRLLFVPEEGPGPARAVLNADDPHSHQMLPPAGEVIWYGLGPPATVRAERIENSFEGLRFELLAGEERAEITSRLAGRVNVYNILAACAAGLSYGIDMATITRGITRCSAVPGRFERVEEGQPFLVVVDYAHTDDALKNVIAVAREMTRGRVITLFGCGGDRDRTKRPLMGMAAAEGSDFVVLTSDNPRSEDPLDIINDALVGLRRYDTPHLVEADRHKAIRLAIGHAGPKDIVLIAGKGHEPYQVLKDRTIDFDDREVAREVLRQFGYRRNGGHRSGGGE